MNGVSSICSRQRVPASTKANAGATGLQRYTRRFCAPLYLVETPNCMPPASARFNGYKVVTSAMPEGGSTAWRMSNRSVVHRYASPSPPGHLSGLALLSSGGCADGRGRARVPCPHEVAGQSRPSPHRTRRWCRSPAAAVHAAAATLLPHRARRCTHKRSAGLRRSGAATQ